MIFLIIPMFYFPEKQCRVMRGTSLEILNPKGVLIASTNASNVTRAKFKKEIEKGFAGSKHRYLKEYGLPADFTYNKKDERSNYLKVFTIKVDK